MALVAFDLDNTLGYFSHVGVWADWFSLDNLTNQFNLTLNPKFKIVPGLQEKLRAAEKLYIQKILENEEIMKSTLRPNLDAMILPLIAAKKEGKIRAICIYSNTWNTFTPILGKILIERLYNCENLFDCVVDASHPIRKHDWANRLQGSQIKTFYVLKSIFKKLCGIKGSIKPCDILFVDERLEKHEIYAQESAGLTYLKPTEYLPNVSKNVLNSVYNIGFKVLEESGLLNNNIYLQSDIFHCLKFGAWGSTNEYIPVENMDDLTQITINSLKSEIDGHKFIDDTDSIYSCINNFLEKF